MTSLHHACPGHLQGVPTPMRTQEREARATSALVPMGGEVLNGQPPSRRFTLSLVLEKAVPPPCSPPPELEWEAESWGVRSQESWVPGP